MTEHFLTHFHVDVLTDVSIIFDLIIFLTSHFISFLYRLDGSVLTVYKNIALINQQIDDRFNRVKPPLF